MKKIEGFDQLDENGNYKPLPVGAYVVEITDVVDHPEKECLEVYHDILEGEHKDHFKNLMEQTGGTNKSRSYRSYKTKAKAFFKGFIVAIEKSNPGFVWDWDEKKLIGKKAVAVYSEEEYIKDDPEAQKVEILTVCKVQEWRSIEALREGKVEIPAKKLLNETDKARYNELKAKYEAAATVKDDLPF